VHVLRAPRRASVFVLLGRRPPGSTLFPYTTLFRSPPVPRLRRPAHVRAVQVRDELVAQADPQDGDAGGGHGLGADAHVLRPQWRSEETRLNSSHVKISYAVFCLKKKKKMRPIRKAA